MLSSLTAFSPQNFSRKDKIQNMQTDGPLPLYHIVPYFCVSSRSLLGLAFAIWERRLRPAFSLQWAVIVRVGVLLDVAEEAVPCGERKELLYRYT